jgi:hypothetical protein
LVKLAYSIAFDAASIKSSDAASTGNTQFAATLPCGAMIPVSDQLSAEESEDSGESVNRTRFLTVAAL